MRVMRAVLTVLAVLSFPALADPPMTMLRIEVKTLAGKPVERASVMVRFLDVRALGKFGRRVQTSWETRTNMEGVVKIPRIPQGKILIQVNAEGYQTFGQKFEVKEEEKTIEIKLNPPQPQYSVHQ